MWHCYFYTGWFLSLIFLLFCVCMMCVGQVGMPRDGCVVWVLSVHLCMGSGDESQVSGLVRVPPLPSLPCPAFPAPISGSVFSLSLKTCRIACCLFFLSVTNLAIFFYWHSGGKGFVLLVDDAWVLDIFFSHIRNIFILSK